MNEELCLASHSGHYTAGEKTPPPPPTPKKNPKKKIKMFQKRGAGNVSGGGGRLRVRENMTLLAVNASTKLMCCVKGQQLSNFTLMTIFCFSKRNMLHGVSCRSFVGQYYSLMLECTKNFLVCYM